NVSLRLLGGGRIHSVLVIVLCASQSVRCSDARVAGEVRVRRMAALPGGTGPPPSVRSPWLQLSFDATGRLAKIPNGTRRQGSQPDVSANAESPDTYTARPGGRCRGMPAALSPGAAGRSHRARPRIPPDRWSSQRRRGVRTPPWGG